MPRTRAGAPRCTPPPQEREPEPRDDAIQDREREEQEGGQEEDPVEKARQLVRTMAIPSFPGGNVRLDQGLSDGNRQRVGESPPVRALIQMTTIALSARTNGPGRRSDAPRAMSRRRDPVLRGNRVPEREGPLRHFATPRPRAAARPRPWHAPGMQQVARQEERRTIRLMAEPLSAARHAWRQEETEIGHRRPTLTPDGRDDGRRLVPEVRWSGDFPIEPPEVDAVPAAAASVRETRTAQAGDRAAAPNRFIVVPRRHGAKPLFQRKAPGGDSGRDFRCSGSVRRVGAQVGLHDPVAWL